MLTLPIKDIERQDVISILWNLISHPLSFAHPNDFYASHNLFKDMAEECLAHLNVYCVTLRPQHGRATIAYMCRISKMVSGPISHESFQ